MAAEQAGMDTPTKKNSLRRVLLLWGVVACLFAGFNAAFWPAHWRQGLLAPEHFMRHAAALHARQDRDGALRRLASGIIAQRPPYAEPYTLLSAWLKEAGRESEARRYEAHSLFYQSLSAGDPAPLLRQAAELEMAQRPIPLLDSAQKRVIETLAADFAASMGVTGAFAGLSPAEKCALISLSGKGLSVSGAIGNTAVLSPVDILVQSGGGEGARRLAHIFVRGRDFSTPKRGLNVVLIDPVRGQVLQWGLFDIWQSAEEAGRLTQFLRDAPKGCIGAFAVLDDASVNLTPALETELAGFGLAREAVIDRQPAFFGLRYSFAAIGVKGAPPDSALQAWSPDIFQGHTGHPVACGVLRAGRAGA